MRLGCVDERRYAGVGQAYYWFDEQASFWVADPFLSLKDTVKRSNDLDVGAHITFNLILKNVLKYVFILSDSEI